MTAAAEHAQRLMTELAAAGLTTTALDQLVQWCAWAHDTRWLELRIAVDGATGDPIYAIEAHTLDLCLTRGNTCRVDHVYHGAGRTITDACTQALTAINQHQEP